MLKYMAISAAATMPSVSSHWKMPVPLPRVDALRHSARYSGTTTPIRPALMPLQQPAEHQRHVAVRQGDHGDADDEQQCR